MIVSDIGLVLEMFGFTFLFSSFWNDLTSIIYTKIRKLCGKKMSTSPIRFMNKYYTNIDNHTLNFHSKIEALHGFGVLIIIVGLILQFSFFNTT